jgi:ABC-type Zn uptake system ZnuABC Zn-binding protein ZnuA
MKAIRSLISVTIGALLAPTWLCAGEPLPDASVLPVATSNTVLADFVQQVGGDSVQVRALAPAGTDPHTFQPTAKTITVLAQAKVILFNGSGLEEWWAKTTRVPGGPACPCSSSPRG